MHSNRRTLNFIATALFLPVLIGGCASNGKAVEPPPIPEPLQGTEILPDPVWPESAPLQKRFAPIDVERYDIRVALLPLAKSIDARVTVEFRVTSSAPIREVELDFEGLAVQSVVDSDNRELEFRHGAGSLIVVMPNELEDGDMASFTVAYSGQPHAGLYFVPDGGDGGLAGQVFTQGECEDTRYWLPCADTTTDRAIWDMTVTMPANWVSLAAGDRLSSQVEGGVNKEFWRMTSPTPPYLISLVAGSFDRSQVSKSGIPIELLLPEDRKNQAAAMAHLTSQTLEFMEDFTGRDYPYSKYGTSWVENFPYGGMENASATTLTANALTGMRGMRDRSPLGLIAHETAHQWFGDLLTCEDWSHIWVQEGFATFCSSEFLRTVEGEAAYLAKWMEMRDRFLDQDLSEPRRGLVHADCIDPMDLFFTGHAYQGGALFLGYLRSHIGESAFRRGVHLYVGANAGRSVNTDDLRDAFERAAGRSLRRFFTQWVNQAGHPEFESSWRFDSERKRVLISLNQVHEVEDGLPQIFGGSMGVEIRLPEGRTYHRIDFSKRRQAIELPCESTPIWVRLDPECVLPAKLTQKRSERDWLILGEAGIGPGEEDNNPFDVTARLRAIAHYQKNLDDIPDPLRQARLNLVRRLAQADPNPYVQESAIQALLSLSGEDSREAMRFLARSSDHTGVRVAALKAMAGLAPVEITAGFSKATYNVGHSWKTMGAAMALWVHADPASAWERIQVEGET
ncbi:MAG: M1 family metallopeptidase, partial [Planctomycetota bacterium]|nr:M1 family metallopeptidase [Planctomycetota bacterium]